MSMLGTKPIHHTQQPRGITVVADVSNCLNASWLVREAGKMARWQLRLVKFDIKVVDNDGMKHQAPDALLKLKTEGRDKNNLDEELLVQMIDETKEQQKVKTEYRDQNQSEGGKARNQMDHHGKKRKLPTLPELIDVQTNDGACT